VASAQEAKEEESLKESCHPERASVAGGKMLVFGLELRIVDPASRARVFGHRRYIDQSRYRRMSNF